MNTGILVPTVSLSGYTKLRNEFVINSKKFVLIVSQPLLTKFPLCPGPFLLSLVKRLFERLTMCFQSNILVIKNNKKFINGGE